MHAEVAGLSLTGGSAWHEDTEQTFYCRALWTWASSSRWIVLLPAVDKDGLLWLPASTGQTTFQELEPHGLRAHERVELRRAEPAHLHVCPAG